ncbi:MAG: ABC transporter ATP-binding protein [Faecalimonas umbilicata]|jgi:energy-coupling factor transport system ATP-binding protein|uniref:ABC transporter ATP-binding protein n=1 Tax=Faecalimonas umbilicata TaxID=1912855 RepID=A0A4R3JN90_9FIRM|nr:ABC transporter ATP-binding protein [Faecalimonas umbilicata]MCI5986059.1 energy-coupling factor ABC transporter ATP-binding protein [Faecalimonas umbilicata]MDY2762904.1 ABC transporter ATP-binding protein [Faecalimonas umbilicata]MDY5094236.1 ABC transporter ATP-binding protein [Faecalimonas umbilicata]TCS66715.1 energy-coupling factor transport system ATP-binding protein [Faecalimonas umbilicata]GBU04369.1 ABC transporter ATP-binding protein [Faecalimonas umbilicata]
MSVCIEFQDVSYAYPLTKKAAVRHLNCKLEKGKCYGVIGPNASGKTTFCNLMRGLCPKFYGGILKGNVLVEGKNLEEWEDGELSVRIGYVFQDPFAQVSGIKETVFEEIGMGLENTGVEQEEMIRRILEIAKVVKVDTLLQKNPLALSGGQCQRVAFASVLALDSDIIVIDEPTSQLDPDGTMDVFEIIGALKRQGKTVIIAEHKVDLLAEYCDEIIAMAEGTIIAQGTVREVFQLQILREKKVRIPQVVTLALLLEEKKKALSSIPVSEREAVAMLKERGDI